MRDLSPAPFRLHSPNDRTTQFVTRWVRFLEAAQHLRPLFFASCLAFTAAVILIDLVSGNEITLTAFYLLPVIVSTSVFGLRIGLLFALLCAASANATRLLNGQQYDGTFVPMWNMLMRFANYAVTVTLLSVLQRGLEQEMARARRDPLTGIANRRGFYEYGADEILRAKKLGHPLTIAYIDVDAFKAVNDHYGHEMGDRVLRVTASTIHDHARAGDIAARLGGDEFAMILPALSRDEAVATVERIHSQLEVSCRQFNIPLTFSIGVVTFNQLPATIDDALARVDEVMYSIKKDGGAAVHKITWDASQEEPALVR